MPRVSCYTICHYGKDYLPWAMRSVYDLVDEFNIVYTPVPSHGHSSNLSPPETRTELLKAAFSYNPKEKPINWYDYTGTLQEGNHRDFAVDICKGHGADLVLVLDSDEIWDKLTLTLALERVWAENSARNWLINFTHLWRSFDYCCKDDGWPVRILDLRHSDGIEYIPREYGDIYHFGYAITDKTMKYKLSIHGHKNELRSNWFKDKWSNWIPGNTDTHPTNENFWTPVPFAKDNLPEFMKNHFFYDLRRIT